MAFIRDRECEYTGFQEHSDYNTNIDLQCDFVMVYGIDKTMPKRIANFKKRGYVVHLMTGIAWGEYQDYLYGKFDGLEHWDEAQTDRNGKHILHGKDVPYMVPTVAFAEYITKKLKVAVDSGVEAIHLEEPEFWDHGGYSEAFKREYELYYKKKWVEPYNDLDAMYKAARLKAYLYTRTIDRVFGALKEYAMVKYGRRLRFYVPTHSLLNYTQWKIVSPEGALIDLATVDGYIAQIWTGTSRTKNIYEGVFKERTFETAYLEYGVMQELVAGTGRRMYFLHDPIEDNPNYSWDDYRYNYLKTVVASLLHPKIHHYEICPWPNRVYNGLYPSLKGVPQPNAKPMPPDYATLHCNLVNTLGDMDSDEYTFEGNPLRIGVFMSDSCLYQRTYPDTILTPEESREALKSIEMREKGTISEKEKLALNTSITLPDFYGLALPLLKRGLAVRPVQLDNIRRFPDYLSGNDVLILSYEFMKPEFPDINNALAAWVREGGTLIYVGDGSDPFHKISAWWNSGAKTTYDNPAQHLFAMLGCDASLEQGIYSVGNGVFAYMCERPADFCLDIVNSAKYQSFVKQALAKGGHSWKESNRLTLRRGNYIICAVMDECSNETLEISGNFVDVFTHDFKPITKATIKPDENSLLYDLDKIPENVIQIIGTTNRITELAQTENGFTLKALGPSNVNAYIRLRLPKKVKEIKSVKSISAEWHEGSRTYLINYLSNVDGIEITAEYEA